MIVISSAIVLQAASPTGLPGGLTLDHPVIGWHNVVTAETIVADTEEAGFPASNLANPATHLEWRAEDDSEQYLTITTNEVDEIDYVGVARHNWGSSAIVVSIEGFIDGVWTEIVEEVMLPDDGPALFRFDPQSLAEIRIKLQTGDDIPRAAVVYVGKLLIVERKVYVGHVPLPHGRKSNVINGMSETGNSLGGIEIGAWRETTIPLSLITPAWHREYMNPFLAAVGKRLPWFFGWRPETYPREIGFCKLVDDVAPVPTGPSNLIAFDMPVIGVV
ncbi:hypothetical protein JQ600_35490 [Bradyrhizobium sp. AUGA SZCCT0176]|uniref:hypothetical protein n=1 Tax=Bradyrhizobium sp. AUGA SZCCT0176 TaxID=2807664 RepID=UPI001BA8A6D2|nr:hypothetical protein [Bradyrhizobium sp. AUGA SZCCT0176]MBR1230201.1 hypothetical protein [Bradyrhizobium sp. AUGA SZCCT0176]